MHTSTCSSNRSKPSAGLAAGQPNPQVRAFGCGAVMGYHSRVLLDRQTCIWGVDIDSELIIVHALGVLNPDLSIVAGVGRPGGWCVPGIYWQQIRKHRLNTAEKSAVSTFLCLVSTVLWEARRLSCWSMAGHGQEHTSHTAEAKCAVQPKAPFHSINTKKSHDIHSHNLPQSTQEILLLNRCP